MTAGGRYRARVRLTDGEGRPLAEAGALCDRVPECSLPWLLAQALVEPVDADPAPAPEEE